MLKKLALFTGTAALALSPVHAKPQTAAEKAAEAAAEAAADAAEAAANAAEAAAVEVETEAYDPNATPDDEQYAKELATTPFNPFAGLENFSLKKPIVELPAPEPARLAAADRVMGKLLSDGTYSRVMTTMQTDLVEPLLNRVWNMKGSEAMALLGIPETEASKSGKNEETFAQAFAKDDPHGRERILAYVTTYFKLLGDMSDAVAPDIRSAMARDFARKYSVTELNDMDRFFATPTGSAFAKDYMMSTYTLDVLQTSLMVWPKMMKAVPDFAERLAKADAHLPPRPKAVEAEAEAESIDGEPWYLSENWSAKDRKSYEKASDAYTTASDKAEQAYSKMSEIESAAIAAAKARYEAEGWKPSPEADAATEAHDHDHE